MKQPNCFHFDTLENTPTKTLYEVFSAAFAQYQTPIRLTYREFTARMNRVGMRPKMSGGYFVGDVLKGFIFTAMGEWEGIMTAYNAGTGLLPEERGKGIAGKIYGFLLEEFRQAGLQQCLLEVISTNDPALRAYQKLGFNITRKLRCFRQEMPIPVIKSPLPFQIVRAKMPDWEQYGTFADLSPTWQNSPRAIANNFEHEEILEALCRYQTIGFIAFERASGRISQIAVHPDFRGKAVGNNLLRAARGLSDFPLSIINIDEKGQAMIDFFKNSCFSNPIDQFEMVLPI